MNRAAKLICLSVVTLVWPALLYCGEKSTKLEWEKMLKRDLVSVRSDKMIFQNYSLCKFGEKEGEKSIRLQVKTYGEAPAKGLISRDNFVSMNTELSTLFVMAAGAAASSPEKAIESFDCIDLEFSIGKPEIEVNLFVTKEGFKVEFVDNLNNKRSGETHTWVEVYSK